ncbi:hypothetical protein LTR53_011352 [Teratosphaeriaceae sp. CCFEE 6253]|nr:hypothetical protein LTR53_011352 [Teratosphaeriaceae sp. CCFEE 6253]
MSVHVWPSLHCLMPGLSHADVPEIMDTGKAYFGAASPYACTLDITFGMKHGLLRIGELMPRDAMDEGMRSFVNYIADTEHYRFSNFDGGQLAYNFLIDNKTLLWSAHLAGYDGVLRSLQPKPDVLIQAIAGRANLNGRPFDGSAAEFAVELCGAGLALAVIVYLYASVSDPLRDVPGPLLARFTRLWELQRVRGNHFEQVNWELHAKYGTGPIVRLAPGRYSINDRTALKQVFGHASKFPKAPFYHAFGHPDPLQADMFSELDINRHGAKRRKVASLYSMTALLSYEQFVDRCNATLCSRLRGFADRPLHVPSWMQYYAFDVIGEITVGEPFGMMDRPECPDPRGILQAIHDSMVYGSRMGLFSELHPWLGRVTSAFGIKIPFDTVMSFIREQIAKRRADKTSAHRADFLDKLLRMQDDNKVSELDIITTIGANIAAGSDTTAISLSSIVYNLLTHPECARKLQAELDDL